MSRSLAFFLALVVSVPALAQSKWEVFAGGSWVRADLSPNLKSFGADHVNGYGWQASVSEYPYWGAYKWLGGTLDVSGFYSRPTATIPAGYFGFDNPPVKTTYSDLANAKAYTFMFGPTITLPSRLNRTYLQPHAASNWRRMAERPFGFAPFGHVLLGAVSQEVTLTSKGENIIGTSYKNSETVFGYALGGGIDVPFSRRWSARGQGDWIRSNFKDNADDRQNNIRITGGLVFRP